MSGVTDLAEWLGIEIVEADGEHWVRQRLNAHGKWFRRDARATSAERKLYDVVRALVYTYGRDVALAPLHRIALVLGVAPTPGLRLADLIEKLAGILADNRHWREKAVGTDEELVRCRREIAELKAGARLGPKGGDRGELVRQLHHAARRATAHQDAMWVQGATVMVNTVLRLLGEPVPTCAPQVSEDDRVLHAVEELKAARWRSHEPGSRAEMACRGEQNAFAMVIALLKGDSVEGLEL